MTAILLPAESSLYTSLTRGEPCVLQGQDRKIRSAVFRALLLQLDHSSFGEEHLRIQCNRWEIVGADFDERLNLTDGRLPDGSPLPALDFTDCTFQGGIKANSAHFERLTFRRSRFKAVQDPEESLNKAPDSKARLSCPISLRYATCVSELRFLSLSPAESDDQRHLWADCTGLRASTVTVNHCTFRAPEGESIAEDGYARYALDLTGAHLSGDLVVTPQVSLHGGLRLRSARVEGEVWARGIELTDGESSTTRPGISKPRYALSAQAIRVTGNFILGCYEFDGIRKSTALGTVWMLGAQIDGELDMRGFQMDYHFALQLSNSHLGSFTLVPLELPLSSIRPAINGGIYMWNTVTETNVTIDADLGPVYLEGSRVGGSLKIDGTVQGITSPGVRVGGEFRLAGEYGTDNDSVLISLRDICVTAQLDISDLRFAPKSTTKELDLRGASIGSSLLVSRAPHLFLSARVLDWQGHHRIRLAEVCLQRNRETDSTAWSAKDLDYYVAYATFLFDSWSGKTTLLNGSSDPLAAAIRDLEIHNKEAVVDYLRLLFAFTWTEQGAVSLLGSEEELPEALKGKCTPDELDYSVEEANQQMNARHARMRCSYLVGGMVYNSVFLVNGSGDVGVDDASRKLIYDGSAGKQITRRYRAPYRYGDAADEPDYLPLKEGRVFSQEEEFDREFSGWQTLLMPNRLTGVTIDLRGAKCDLLRDSGGTAWENAKLRLENFTYNRISMTNNEIGSRSAWLTQQPKGSVFTPQPYTHLAGVLLSQGDEEASREIEKDKIHRQMTVRIERSRNQILQAKRQIRELTQITAEPAAGIPQVSARQAYLVWAWAWLKAIGWRVWEFVYGKGFGYGLSIGRAIMTMALCWLFGGMVVWAANGAGQLKLATASVSTQATTSGTEVSPTILMADEGIPDLPCGREINPLLYAIEVFTPLLNLHQESRCEIREPESKQGIFAFQRLLEFAKFFYELLGYLITSLSVLTFSGMARRWDTN